MPTPRPRALSRRRESDLGASTTARREDGLLVGSADECVPYHTSIDYYEKVIDRFGGLESVQSFFKFYIVPGMSHGGGPGINQIPDMLPAVRAWRENGRRRSRCRPAWLAGKWNWRCRSIPTRCRPGGTQPPRSFTPVQGRRGGVGLVSPKFLPPAAE